MKDSANTGNSIRMKKKENRGGRREGSGRPKKRPTVTIAFRVDADKAEELREKIKKIISETLHL